MASYKISDREDAALMGLSMLAQLLYVRVFRARMDYGSGIAGGLARRNMLFYFVLAEVVSFVPDRGSKRKPWQPSTEELRSAVRELERGGLLEDMGSNKQRGLVKKCVLAELGSFVWDMNPTGTPREPREMIPAGNAFNDAGFDGMNPAGYESASVLGTPAHQVSGIREGVVDAAVVDSARAGVDRDFVPRNKNDWFQLFVNVLGFRYEKTRSAKMAVAVDAWVRDGVSVGVVLDAVDVADSKCGSKPGSPVYYIGFVDERLREGVRYEQSRQAGGGGRCGGGKISAAERRRREEFEYGRRKGLATDAEWEEFKRSIGEPGRSDPFRAGDADPVASHG